MRAICERARPTWSEIMGMDVPRAIAILDYVAPHEQWAKAIAMGLSK